MGLIEKLGKGGRLAIFVAVAAIIVLAVATTLWKSQTSADTVNVVTNLGQKSSVKGVGDLFYKLGQPQITIPNNVSGKAPSDLYSIYTPNASFTQNVAIPSNRKISLSVKLSQVSTADAKTNQGFSVGQKPAANETVMFGLCRPVKVDDTWESDIYLFPAVKTNKNGIAYADIVIPDSANASSPHWYLETIADRQTEVLSTETIISTEKVAKLGDDVAADELDNLVRGAETVQGAKGALSSYEGSGAMLNSFKGDIDGDLDVDSSDISKIQEAIRNPDKLSQRTRDRIDVNSDGNVDTQDYFLARKKYLRSFSTQEADFNGDGLVGIKDATRLSVLRSGAGDPTSPMLTPSLAESVAYGLAYKRLGLSSAQQVSTITDVAIKKIASPFDTTRINITPIYNVCFSETQASRDSQSQT